MNDELVSVDDQISEGLESTKFSPGLEIPRETINEIKSWAQNCEFNENDLADIHRGREFDGVRATVEHFNGHTNHITLTDEDDNHAALMLPDFLRL